MKNTLLLTFLLVLSFVAKTQTFTDSNLPIVIITTDNDPKTSKPLEILDDPRVLATMKIIYHSDNSRNYLTDQTTTNLLNYNGRISIEIRGSTSQLLPKKPYGLTTLLSDNVSNNNVSLLGMPKENDWVLNAMAFDSSLVRDYLSYDLSRNLGNYASRGMYCEVIVNGDYKGLYILGEKVKVDSERINVLKIATTDIDGSNVTGGYVTKCDKTTGGDPIAWTMLSYNDGYVGFIHESPKPEDVTTQQNTYIKNQFTTFQSLVTAKNESISNGYPSVIDIPSFVDFMLVNEIASNVDAYQYSTYLHKDRSGKLRAGPVWDFNLTYGNDLFSMGYDRSHTTGWQFDNGDNTGAKFWKDLYTNTTFKCYLTKRWKEMTATGQPFDYAVISARIDQLVTLISEAKAREQTRWTTVGDHTKKIAKLKTWLQSRITWLNTNLSNYSACANPSLPPLVISKIHYNPLAAQGKTSNDLEFIEISNNSNQSVNLTGVYFRELGLSYSFPVNSTIAANEKIYLASNAAVYQEFYGTVPFGQFTRNLSNSSQKIVLADAFGNIIDYVPYSDATPWPKAADGSGSYLQLNNLDDDNSLAASWTASSPITGLKGSEEINTLSIYPNPSQKNITVSSSSFVIDSYELTDLLGQKIKTSNHVGSNTLLIDVEELPSNTYLLKVTDKDGTSIVKRFVKL